MIKIRSETGQAIILLAFAIIALVGFAALAIDGGRILSDKRHAQNAADAAAFAGAFAYSRSTDIVTAAQSRATSNEYDGGALSDVTVTVVDSPPGVCPANTQGKDITVVIDSYVKTTFARVLGRDEVKNTVIAISRSCGSFYGPPFDGNAIVSLSPSGIGYDANGNVGWNITGGGIFSNSSSANAAHCQSNSSEISVPSVTVVGGYSWGNCNMDISGGSNNNATQLSYAMYASLFPRQPICNGTASLTSGQWHPQPGKDGSRVALNGDMDFAPGLYCITNSPGPYHGALTGSDVTFFVMSPNFSITFNGSGNSFNATAPTDPDNEYRGILMYVAPQVDVNGNLLNTQEIDLRGNGDADIVGTIIAPSADVTMFGNSGTGAINSQIIAYQVDAGGTADINLAYQVTDNYIANLPFVVSLLR